MRAIIERFKGAAVVIIGDSSLLASLYLAHFIVWRNLRTRFKERAARLKNLKLIKGSGHLPIRREVLIPVCPDGKKTKSYGGQTVSINAGEPSQLAGRAPGFQHAKESRSLEIYRENKNRGSRTQTFYHRSRT